jgi:hypothetical protein
MRPDNEEREFLFSYGTLQTEAVQLATFGRRLNAHPDVLAGYKLVMIEIHDQDFAASSGTAHHRTIHFTGNKSDMVQGAVLSLTKEDLVLADSYEPAGYTRIQVQLRSGSTAWVYINSNSR